MHPYAASPAFRRRSSLLAGTALAGALACAGPAWAAPVASDPQFTVGEDTNTRYEATVTVGEGTPKITVQAAPGYVTNRGPTELLDSTAIDLTLGSGNFGAVVVLSGTYDAEAATPADPAQGFNPSLAGLGSGNVHVTIVPGVNVATDQTFADYQAFLTASAVVAVSGEGDVHVENNGSVTGTGFASAITAFSLRGAVEVTGGGSVNGRSGSGILASTGSDTEGNSVEGASASVRITDIGNVTMTRGSGDTSSGVGVEAGNGGSGDIVIARIGSVTSRDGTAISAYANGGRVYVGVDPLHNGSDQATKDYDKLSEAVSGWTGIEAGTSGDGFIKIATATGGTVTGTQGAGIAAAIFGSDSSGGIEIDAEDAVQGAGAGIAATANGRGSVIVKGAGAVSGASADDDGTGIFTYSRLGSIDVSGAGTTTAAGAGAGIAAFVAVKRDAGGAPAEDDIGNYIADDNAADASGTIRITRSGAVTADRGPGIEAVNLGTGNIVIAGIGAITSTGGTAISASAKGGNVYVGEDPSATDPGQDPRLWRPVSGTTGIDASTTGDGDIAIATRAGGTITGTTGDGIHAASEDGSIGIAADATVSGVTNGISATTSSGMIAIGGAGMVSGAGTDGGEGFGIAAYSSNGSIGVFGTGATSASGTGNAINAAVGGGVGLVYVSRTGDISSDGGYGINAVHGGTGGIFIDGIGNVTSEKSTAIVALANGGGNIDVGGKYGLTGAIRGRTGIDAKSTGEGSVSVRIGNGGSLFATGTDSESTAINIQVGTGTATVSIATGGLVKHGDSSQAIVVSYEEGGHAVIENAGRIYGSITAKLVAPEPALLAAKSTPKPAGAPAPSNTLSNTGSIYLFDDEAITGFATLENEAGGNLSGTGYFGNVHAKAGSFILPGADEEFGGLTVGDLTMEKGSTLNVRALLVPSGGELVGDWVTATGNVTLNGATLYAKAAPNTRADWKPWKTGVSYAVLKAEGTLEGSMVADTNLAFLKPSVTVDSAAKTVSLTLTPRSIEPSLLTSGNQKAVYDAIAPFQDKDLSGLAETLVDGFNNLSEEDAPAALEQLSGSSSTGGQTASFSGAGLFGGSVITQVLVAGGVSGAGGPVIQGSNGGPSAYAGEEPVQTAALKAATPKDAVSKAPVAPPAPASTWRLWATMLGAQSTTDARAFQPRVTGNDWGLAAGFDYVLDPNLVAGVALGGTSSRFSAGHGATTGTTDGLHASLYGIATFDAFYAAGSLGYGRLETRATRTVSAFGAPQRYAGKVAGDAFTAQTEFGYRIAWEAFTVTPFAGLQATLLRQHGYTESAETAGAAAALAYAAQDTWSVPGSLGIQVERGFSLDGGWLLTAQARAAWVHEFSPERKARPSFVALPGSSFTVDGIAATENLARLTGGVTLANGKGTSLFATLTSDLAAHARSYAAQGGVKLEW